MIDLAIGSTAPDFELSTIDGDRISLFRLRGAPVLLNFYKSNCSWCQIELPRLAPAYDRLHNKRIHVLGIDIGEEGSVAARFAQEKKLNIPVLIDDGSICDAYRLKRVPTFVLVNEDGKIARVYEGVTEQLTGIIELTLLAAAGHHQLPEYSLVGNGCSPKEER